MSAKLHQKNLRSPSQGPLVPLSPSLKSEESTALHRQLFNKIYDVDTDSDEDEDETADLLGFEDVDSDDSLDEEEKLLQRTILRNFLGRTKTRKLMDTSAAIKINDGEEETYKRLSMLKSVRLSTTGHESSSFMGSRKASSIL